MDVETLLELTEENKKCIIDKAVEEDCLIEDDLDVFPVINVTDITENDEEMSRYKFKQQMTENIEWTDRLFGIRR